MSFRSRQKKRQARAAEAAIARARVDSRDVMRGRHYLTLTRRACSCNACGGALREGAEMVYRFEPREVLCKLCAESRGIKPRPSQSWERQHRRGRRRSGRRPQTRAA